MQQQENQPFNGTKRTLKPSFDISQYQDIDPLVGPDVVGPPVGRSSHNGIKDLVEKGILEPPLKLGGKNYWFLSQLKAALERLKAMQKAQWEAAQDPASAQSETDEGEVQPPKSSPDQPIAGASFGDHPTPGQNSVETPPTAPPAPNRDEAA